MSRSTPLWSSPRSLALSSAPAAVPLLLASGDAGATRVVYAMVIGLVGVGVGFVALGVWLIGQTRRDLDVLAPLDLMGRGDWLRSDPDTQQQMLDAVRPPGARPLRRSAPRFTPSSVLDVEALQASQSDPTLVGLELDPIGTEEAAQR